MRPVDIASLMICLLIIALVLYSFLKHGRGNPETTGSLGRQLRSHATKLAEMEETLKGCATTAALGVLSSEVRALEKNAASSGEVNALEAKINGMQQTLTARIEAVKETGEDTRDGVRRIEAILMKGALDK